MRALAVSSDGTVLVYQLNKLVVAAEVAEEVLTTPRRVYFRGAQVQGRAGALEIAEVAQELLSELPTNAVGATVSEQGVQFLRAQK